MLSILSPTCMLLVISSLSSLYIVYAKWCAKFLVTIVSVPRESDWWLYYRFTYTCLYSSTTTLADCLRDIGSRRVNEWHQTDKAEIGDGKIQLIRVELVPFRKLLRIQFQVSKSNKYINRSGNAMGCISLKNCLYQLDVMLRTETW